MVSPVILPKLTYEMQEGRILDWLVAEGEPVNPGQTIFTVETDKATAEVPAEEPGVLLKVLVRAGETVPVATPVAYIGAVGEMPPGAPASAISAGSAGPVADDLIPASPIARKLARELGVDLKAVQTFSGQKRVREADVQAYVDAQKAASAVSDKESRQPTPAAPPVKPAPLAAPAPPAPEPSPISTLTSAAAATSAYALVRPTPLQKAMAARMAQAAAIPQMAAACDVDLTALEQLKNQLRPGWEAAQGYRLTYTHLLAALVARAAGACPAANASWTAEGIRFYRDVNLGVAMASERGLVVPVVQNAGRRPLREVAGEIVRLQHAAEQNRLPASDLEGGTITLTNVGMLGITLSIPLLNPPQSAIVGVGARREQAALEGGEIKVKPVIAVTVVADHRVIDGAAVAAFLGQIKQLLEHPGAALGAVDDER